MITIPISIGELVDKLSILEIKKENIKEKGKLLYIKNEYILLYNIYENLCEKTYGESLKLLYNKLYLINKDLWKIEDDIRIKELNKEFDAHFIGLARSVYVTNDKRFNIKNEINLLTKSNITEVKSYEDYE